MSTKVSQLSNGAQRTISITTGGGGLVSWVSGASYVIGDIVYYTDNKIYRCTVTNSDVSFTLSHWQELSASSGTNLVQSTTISSATIGSWNTGITSAMPIIHAYFWNNASAQFEELSETSLTLNISSSFNTISYDTTLLTFNSGDYVLLVATYSGNVTIGASLINNYIANSSNPIDTTDWATYADAASSTPTDGTGGSPSVTITRNTTTPLRGSADFKFSKDAANRQGQGVSYDFTIASADQSKPMFVTGEYRVTSNYSYTNNDLVCYIYDVTNAVLIQPTPFVLDGSGKFRFEFQSNAGSTSYRLIFHVATTNASAWDFFFTNIVVSATPVPMTISTQDKQYDISAYVTGTNISQKKAIAIPYKTKSGIWRMRFNIAITVNPNQTSNVLTVSGVTFSSTSLLTQSISVEDNTNGYAAGGLCSSNSSTISIYGNGTSTNGWYLSGDVELASIPTWAVDYYPAQLGDGAETRVVAARYENSSGIALSNGSNTDLTGGTMIFDTHSAYNPSTGIFTVPVSGIYRVSAVTSLQASTDWDGNSEYCALFLYKNGSSPNGGFPMARIIPTNTTATQHTLVGSEIIKCNAGDLLKVTATQNSGNTRQMWFYQPMFERISGPATIAASEFVGARYTTAAGNSITNSVAVVVFGTKNYDTHNAYNSSTGVFTAPSSGYYSLSVNMLTNSATWNAGDTFIIEIQKNGSAFSVPSYNRIQATISTYYYRAAATQEIYLNAGETLAVAATVTSNKNLFASNEHNQIQIHKLNK